jgi:hypothetical protein
MLSVGVASFFGFSRNVTRDSEIELGMLKNDVHSIVQSYV